MVVSKLMHYCCRLRATFSLLELLNPKKLEKRKESATSQKHQLLHLKHMDQKFSK